MKSRRAHKSRFFRRSVSRDPVIAEENNNEPEEVEAGPEISGSKTPDIPERKMPDLKIRTPVIIRPMMIRIVLNNGVPSDQSGVDNNASASQQKPDAPDLPVPVSKESPWTTIGNLPDQAAWSLGPLPSSRNLLDSWESLKWTDLLNLLGLSLEALKTLNAVPGNRKLSWLHKMLQKESLRTLSGGWAGRDAKRVEQGTYCWSLRWLDLAASQDPSRMKLLYQGFLDPVHRLKLTVDEVLTLMVSQTYPDGYFIILGSLAARGELNPSLLCIIYKQLKNRASPRAFDEGWKRLMGHLYHIGCKQAKEMCQAFSVSPAAI